MKKIQFVFVMLAFFTASLGVYATQIASDVIYYEDNLDSGHCNLEIALPCTEGGSMACKSSGNNVWKSVDGGACTQVFRP